MVQGKRTNSKPKLAEVVDKNPERWLCYVLKHIN